MNLLCPACGAEVVFKSRFSIFSVCSFCRSTLVRSDLNIDDIGKMSVLPQDMSPLQIGTSGIFDGSKFEVIGRQRIGWEGGSWNEWYLNFENGHDGWLADAQGFYVVSFQLQDGTRIPDLSSLSIASFLTINGFSYTVDDIHEVICVGSQGELPVKSVKGRRSTSVDLIGNDEKFGNIDYSSDHNRLFLGKYIELEKLKLMNLRKIDGW